VAIAGAFMIGLDFGRLCCCAKTGLRHSAGGLGARSDTHSHVSLPLRDCRNPIQRDDRPHPPFTAVIVPFWLVRVMVSWEETLEVFPAILVVGFFLRPDPVFLVELR